MGRAFLYKENFKKGKSIMSYANENETVLTNDTFEDWAKECNGNKAAMKCGAWSDDEPLYHLNEATGTKTELERYEFCYHPLKLDATADEIIEAASKLEPEVIEVPQPNRTATAVYYAKAGHKIVEHCEIGE